MFNLLKKDVIIYKNFIKFSFIYYIILNLSLTVFVIYQKLYPWSAIRVIAYYNNSIFEQLILSISTLIVVIFNYLLFFKENYLFTLSLNVNKPKIYLSKLTLSVLFLFINVMFFGFLRFLKDITFTYTEFPVFNDYFTDINSENLILILFIFIIGSHLIHNFGIVSYLLRNLHPNKRFLMKILMIIIYLLLTFICGVSFSYGSSVETSWIYFLIGFVLLTFINLVFIKRVDV